MSAATLDFSGLLRADRGSRWSRTIECFTDEAETTPEPKTGKRYRMLIFKTTSSDVIAELFSDGLDQESQALIVGLIEIVGDAENGIKLLLTTESMQEFPSGNYRHHIEEIDEDNEVDKIYEGEFQVAPRSNGE